MDFTIDDKCAIVEFMSKLHNLIKPLHNTFCVKYTSMGISVGKKRKNKFEELYNDKEVVDIVNAHFPHKVVAKIKQTFYVCVGFFVWSQGKLSVMERASKSTSHITPSFDIEKIKQVIVKRTILYGTVCPLSPFHKDRFPLDMLKLLFTFI